MSDLPKTDFTQRFIFDNSDTRGELASLDHSYAEVLAKHTYPQPVQQLLGELMAAAALLVGSLKFDGLMSLQARSEGPVPLLMIEITSEREIRGLARFEADQIKADATLADLMPNGVLALTIDPAVGKRYQGIVDLDGADLSACFTHYFVMSHQVPTRFWLAADGKRARGMLLQQLPAEVINDEEARAESWQRLNMLGDTLKVEELLGLDNENILIRLFHEEELRVFADERIEFQCKRWFQVRWPTALLFDRADTFRIATIACQFGAKDALVDVWAEGGHVSALESSMGFSGLSISGPLNIVAVHPAA